MQTIDGTILDLGSMCIVDDLKNRQLQPSQSQGQLCINPQACRDAIDLTQPPPDAVYVPITPANYRSSVTPGREK